MPISTELMRKRAHVAGALHIVLAAKRIHADAGAADISSRHRKVRDPQHHGAALAVFGYAESVVNRAVGGATVHPRGGANFIGRHAGYFLGSLGRVALIGNEILPYGEFLRIASLR